MSTHSRIMLGSRRAYIVHNGIAHQVNIFTLVSWLYHRRPMRTMQ